PNLTISNDAQIDSGTAAPIAAATSDERRRFAEIAINGNSANGTTTTSDDFASTAPPAQIPAQNAARPGRAFPGRAAIIAPAKASESVAACSGSEKSSATYAASGDPIVASAIAILSPRALAPSSRAATPAPIAAASTRQNGAMRNSGCDEPAP